MITSMKWKNKKRISYISQERLDYATVTTTPNLSGLKQQRFLSFPG